MTNKQKRIPPLDRPAKYQIIVPGMLDSSWSDFDERIDQKTEHINEGEKITNMTVKIDQAALRGLLRRIYSRGISLISVDCIDAE